MAILVSATGLCGFAQNEWQGNLELGTTIATVEGATPSLDLKFTALKPVHDYFSIGFGTGISENASFQSGPNIPVYLRAQFDKVNAKISPFFSFDLGYAINTAYPSDGPIVLNPTIGVRFDHFSLGVGYTGNVSTHGYGVSNCINIRLAYIFGLHKTRQSTAFQRFFNKFDYSLEVGATFSGTHHNYFEGNVDYSDKSNGLCLSGAMTYNVWRNLSVGLTLGFERVYRTERTEDSELRKLYKISYNRFVYAARFKYDLKECTFLHNFYPFIRLDLGAVTSRAHKKVVDLEDGGDGWDNYDHFTNFYCSPAIGLSYMVNGGKSSIDLSVGCNYNGKNNSFPRGSKDYSASYKQAVGRISLGYTF